MAPMCKGVIFMSRHVVVVAIINTQTLAGLGQGRIDPWSKAYAFDPPVTFDYKPVVSKERATAPANVWSSSASCV